MIDIDFFKKVNDNYGHPAGDRVIKSLSRLLRQRLRGADVIGRYGGEEFAVTIPAASHSACVQVSQEIVKAVHALAIPHAKNNDWGVTTISVGGIWQAAANGPVKHLFRQADEKLYLAKERGRNRAEL